MGLGLTLLGAAFGLICAVFAVATGQVGPLAAIGLYSVTGVTFIILWIVIIALKPDEDPVSPTLKTRTSAAIHR